MIDFLQHAEVLSETKYLARDKAAFFRFILLSRREADHNLKYFS